MGLKWEKTENFVILREITVAILGRNPFYYILKNASGKMRLSMQATVKQLNIPKFKTL